MDTSLGSTEDARIDTFLGPLGMHGGTSCCEPHSGRQVDTFLVTIDARMDTSLGSTEDARIDTFLGPLGMLGGASCCEPHAGHQVDTFLVTTEEARIRHLPWTLKDAWRDILL
jgi:hypothetical protein